MRSQEQIEKERIEQMYNDYLESQALEEYYALAPYVGEECEF